MSNYVRYSGEVNPDVPPTAPLELRLPSEVYALDGLGCAACPQATGAFGASGKILGVVAILGVAVLFMMKKK